jgi:7-alpha-hydroxysteroid dehydrogenase
MKPLAGKVALVTGAVRRIGRAIALSLAADGAAVIVHGRTSQAEAQAVTAEIEQLGGASMVCLADVVDEGAVRDMVERIDERFGRLDVLVNNAGGTMPRAAMDTDERYFETALRFNVTTAFLLTQRAARAMVDTAGEGAVVNISSRSSDMVQTAFVAYAAGKAALNMMTRNFAAELAPRVRINAISVGGFATQSLEVVLTDDALRAQFEAGTPMRRPGEPEDIACAALYLASPASSWVTGKIFQIDGGTEAPSISVPVAPIEPAT